MKKTYTKPEISVIGFEAEDIIQTSGITEELAPFSWDDAEKLDSKTISVFE